MPSIQVYVQVIAFACSFSPAESPCSKFDANDNMNADFRGRRRNTACKSYHLHIHLDAGFLRRQKVRVHSSIQTTVDYGSPHRCMALAASGWCKGIVE